MAYEEVTKIQAAERNLRVAIRLFFEDRDLVAVHTLVTAALGVLRGLGSRRGLGSLFADNLNIRPEKKGEVLKIFTEAQNFFKHADRDPNARLKFYYEATQFYLLDAALLYNQLTRRQFPEATALFAWSMVKFPDLLVEGAFKEQIQGLKVDPDNHRLLLLAMDNWSGQP